MADHENSNANEAAIALEKAQNLLFENNLTRADIITSDGQPQPNGIGKIEGIETIGYTWRCRLLAHLARANLCKVIRSPSENKWHLFGSYNNVLAVLEMYHWITPELERMAMKAWQQYRYDGTGRENARSWKSSYFVGASETIGNRLQASLNQFEASVGHALVPYNKELLQAAIKRVFPHLVASHYRIGSYDGLATGRRDGNNITLKPQRKLNSVLALK